MAAPGVHPVYAWEVPPNPRPAPVVEPDPDPGEVERLAAREIWRVAPSSKPAGADLTPFITEWFQHLDSKRYRRHGQWVPTLLEFNRHAGENMLAVGDGLGLDWVRFAQGGADITIVDPSADRLRLYRKQFAVRGANGQFIQAPFDHLPFPDERVDVVCAVFNEPPVVPWAAAVEEVKRVLRPGGKVILVLPSKYNAARWQDLLMPWRSLFWRRPKGPPRFTARELREGFAAFNELKVYKRHLRRSELPYVWRWMLLPVAERLIGRFLVLKAFKPLIAAGAVRKAA
jgi:SAM-dependent methyltransferase